MGRSRSRAAITTDAIGYLETMINSDLLIGDTKYLRHQDASYSSDETHPIWNLKDSSGRKNPYVGMADIGGPFDLTSVHHEVPLYGSQISQAPGFIWKRYRGPVCAYFLFNVPEYQSTPMTASDIITRMPESIDSLASRWGQGGTAISRCAPARPEAALTVSLIEMINDGVPSILSKVAQSRHNMERFRSMGKDYLNVEFGWKPFVSDIRQMAQAVVSQEMILEDLSRNSGKRLRRRYAFDGINNTTEVADNFTPWPFAGGTDLISQASHRRVETSTKKTWFAGEFVYRVPDLHGIGGVGAKARHLLGLDLTPATLWNATPWTWLGDWLANTGDVLSNISSMSADDLVMRYGYLMQETKMVVESHHTGVNPLGMVTGSIPTSISGKVTFKRQTRCAASPFGFGLTSTDFSPRQWAVLGALGTSRGR